MCQFMDVHKGGLSSYSKNLVKELVKQGSKNDMNITYKLIHTRRAYINLPNVQEIILPFSETLPRKIFNRIYNITHHHKKVRYPT